MTKLFFIIVPLILMQACNTYEPDHSMISPLTAIKIDSVQINDKQVTTTVTYSIRTPCWYYYKTESSNDDNVFTSKVFGKYDGEICVQVVSSLKHIEKVNFLTAGIKYLRFWQNDSTYLDTTITVQYENEFLGKLEIKTEKLEYYIGEDFSSDFALVLGTIFNTSHDTFYSNLGDGTLSGIDQDELVTAEGNDGYFEKYISDNNWEQLNRGILAEGSKIIRILPSKTYNLEGSAYIDSNTVGKFRLRINYYKTYSQNATDTLKDTSNTFFIYKR